MKEQRIALAQGRWTLEKFDLRRYLPSLIRWFVLVGLVVVLTILNEYFFTWNNIINVLRQATILTIVSVGLTTVLLTGGMDLSVGGTMALVGCLAAQLMKAGVPIPLAVVIGLAAACLVGLLNGILVGTLDLPPFVATYGTYWITEGAAMILMRGAIIFGLPRSFRIVGTGYVGAIPVPVIITAVLIVLGHLFLTKTAAGRDIYFVGSNRDAAYYSGVRVRKTLLSVYVFSALMAGIAGLIMTARLDAAQAGMGQPFVLQGVAAVIMGGTSRIGGEGGIPGSVIGAMILTLVVNGMNLLGVSSLAQTLVVGLVILFAVSLDQLRLRWTD